MTRDKYGLRASLYRGERFILGDAQAGYSLHRMRLGGVGGQWHSVVWSDGSACRTDSWGAREEAINYALHRALHYGGRSWREVRAARAALREEQREEATS